MSTHLSLKSTASTCANADVNVNNDSNIDADADQPPPYLYLMVSILSGSALCIFFYVDNGDLVKGTMVAYIGIPLSIAVGAFFGAWKFSYLGRTRGIDSIASGQVQVVETYDLYCRTARDPDRRATYSAGVWDLADGLCRRASWRHAWEL